MTSAMALVGVNDLSFQPTKKPKSTPFQIRHAQFSAVGAGELHLKEPVIANEHDMVVCGVIEFMGGVRGDIRVSRSVESNETNEL
jgi:hypothetical protein